MLRKDGKPVYVSMSAALLKDKEGMSIGSVRVSRDITKEVELEEEIVRERDRLYSIFETMPDGVYITSKGYKVEFMNNVLKSEFGDYVGDICYKVFHNREEPCPKCKHSEVMKGKTVRREWFSRRENKTYDLIETPLTNIDGTSSKSTIFRDITERKQAEKELKASHKFLEAVIENIPDTITLKDSEHRLTLVNQAYCNRAGVTKDEVIGKTVFWEYDAATFQTGAGLYTSARTYTDIEGKRHQVSVKKASLVDESGKITHVLTISRDITEQKYAEELLRTAEQDWRDSFNSLDDVMLIIDRDYNIENINEIGLKLLGKSKVEVIGHKCYQVISGADIVKYGLPIMALASQTK